MPNLLVIEDDTDIAELIKINLQHLPANITIVNDGREALLEAATDKYDLILLDIMLPGMNGIDICKELRLNRITTPIIFLTSKSEEIDLLIGLESGADDYIKKPFSIRELQARVKANIRREKFQSLVGDITTEKPIHIKNLKVDQAKRKVMLNNDSINLTPKEYDLLCYLANHSGLTFSRSQLLNIVWGQEYAGYEHTVNSHINRLRGKIEKDPNDPKYILTTWGVGYRFTDEHE